MAAYFGFKVAFLNSNTFLLSAQINGGTVYSFVYNGSQWNINISVSRSDSTSINDFFGQTFVISGTWLIISNPYAYNNNGSVYVYTYNGNSFSACLQTINSTSLITGSYFGQSIAMNGNFLIVGAYLDLNGGFASIFFYDGATWQQTQKIAKSSGQSGDNFGYSVDINNYFIFVGADGDSSLVSGGGAVYVFAYNDTTWNLTYIFYPNDSAVNIEFGYTAYIYSNSLFVCALTGNTPLKNSTGALYIFQIPVPSSSTPNIDYTLSRDAIIGIVLGSVGGTALIIGAGAAYFFFLPCRKCGRTRKSISLKSKEITVYLPEKKVIVNST